MHLLLAAEGAATGAEHALEQPDIIALNWLPAVTTIVVFLIAFGVLYVKVWPMITKGLDDRQNKIRHEIESAEEARAQAKEALAEYERELAGAHREAGEMIAKAKADAKAAGAELRTRNEAELAEMKQRATQDLQAAKRAAIIELHAEAVTLAADIAAKILKREISAEDQQRLVDESLEELTTAQDT
ncbi:MAG: F0F1 ATP synthase subunit B [Planctomycetota bacterium]|jgi:F-type H+-transporting ATPase subunit b